MASLQEWLDNFQQQNVAIWCDDPEAHKEKIAGGLGGKTYLSYRILYKQAGRDVVGVRHRYSEFESMRVELRDRYHPLGILVPALPPKNLITSMTSTMLTGGTNKVDQPFVKERTLGLTLFCEVIIPLYFTFSLLIIFCSHVLTSCVHFFMICYRVWWRFLG